jgi:hypothetical protein
MVVAKFNVQSNVPTGDTASINLHAVYDPDKNSENGQFFKWTPSGNISLGVVNPAAAEQFVPGEEVYCYFVRAGENVQFKSDAVAQTKGLRMQIDRIIKQMEQQTTRTSRSRSIALTKLEEAKMWLGKDLNELGTPNPYPQANNPASPVIEKPTEDSSAKA